MHVTFVWSNLCLGGLSTDDNSSSTNDAGQKHTADNSWLRRFIGIFAKWANNIDEYNTKLPAFEAATAMRKTYIQLQVLQISASSVCIKN